MLQKFRTLTHARQIQCVLAVVAAVLLAYLLFAEKPWNVSAPEGRSLKISQFATIYLWYAAAINLVLTGLLAATARWWSAPLRRSEIADGRWEMGDGRWEIGDRRSSVKHPRWFWPLVILAMTITAIVGWPRLGQSLWHDEAYPVRRAILGTYRTQDDGSLKLKNVSWQETFFYYTKPNHMLHSVLCRVSNDTWRFFAKPKGLQFNEVALRIPTYLAGIASIACIALFVRKLGYPSAAVVAAFLFALHPWQIRYATEGRAYAFVFVLVPLLFYFFLQALERGKWRWWIAFAATQVLLMHAYLTCIHILVVFNLCAPLAIWFQYGKTRESLIMGTRWFVSNVFAAMAFLQLMLPIVPQLIHYLDETHELGDVDYRWTQSFLSHLLSGQPWSYTLNYETPYIEIYPWAVNHPGLFVLIGLLAIGFLVTGIRRLIADGPVRGLLVIPLLLPAVGCFIQMRITSGHMYVWYIIYILPGVVAIAAIGLDELISAARSRAGKIAAIAAVVALLGAYAAWTTPQRNRLMSGPLQPNRESVLLTRPTLDPNDPRQEKIITSTFFGDPYLYDPRMVTFRTMPKFAELIQKADAEGKELYVNLGYLVTVEGEHIHKYEFLKNSGLFEDLGLLRGYQSLQSRHVFRYKPGSAAGFDFSTVPPDLGSPGHDEE